MIFYFEFLFYLIKIGDQLYVVGLYVKIVCIYYFYLFRVKYLILCLDILFFNMILNILIYIIYKYIVQFLMYMNNIIYFNKIFVKYVLYIF